MRPNTVLPDLEGVIGHELRVMGREVAGADFDVTLHLRRGVARSDLARLG